MFVHKNKYIFMVLRANHLATDEAVIASGKRDTLEAVIIAGRAAADKAGYAIVSYSNISNAI